MTRQPNGTQFEYYKSWEFTKQTPYDYKNNGLIKRIVSKPLANTDNPVLKIILQFYESSIVFILKYIDILHHFRDVHWNNR